MRTSGRRNCRLSAYVLGINLLVASCVAQVVTTTAGGYVGDGGPATSAGLTYPRFVLQDAAGNTYLSDTFNHRIRKIAPSGMITTFAGTGIAAFSGDGGLARNACLSYPSGIVFDAAGNMLVADQGNNRIRKIDTAGIITTIAGTGVAGFSGDNGPATLAELNEPWGLNLDSGGNIFFTDIVNERVRKIDTSGIITTVAGNGTAGYNGDNIPATSAELNFPRGVVLDNRGNLFIADTMNHRVRKVNPAGTISTFAGNGMQGFSGDGGPATSAAIGNPRGLLIRGNQLLISNAGAGHIRFVNSLNIINTLAGNTVGYDGDGNPPNLTDFNGATGMWFTATGSLLVGDQTNFRLREVTPAAGGTKAGSFGPDNSRSTQSVLISPLNFSFDQAGNYFIAESSGNRIREVHAGSGQITTVAGNGTTGYSGDGGPPLSAQLNNPLGVAVDQSGNIYIADTNNAVIRKVDAITNTIDLFASDPSFSDLVSLTVDAAGNLYSADDGACVIRKITPTGVISVVAGDFTCGYNGDGILAVNAEINSAYGVAVDIQGNLFIGDTLNNRIRKVNPSGVISTIAGTGTCGFSGDGGSAISAMICNPLALTVDSSGNLYFADELNLRVRRITRNGKINTIAGSGNSGYNGENLPATSTNLDDPVAVGIDSVGAVFVLDNSQARVRKIH
jgi:sugar lactone lactonase YvrE